MLTLFRLLITAVLWINLINHSYAQNMIFPGNANCPWAQNPPTHTWMDYLGGKYGDKEPYLSIKFSQTIGSVGAGRCYTVTYFRPNKWKADGYNVILNKDSEEPEFRSADLSKYELTVWGAIFQFNEAGEVYYTPSGRLVGQMYCHLGSINCDK